MRWLGWIHSPQTLYIVHCALYYIQLLRYCCTYGRTRRLIRAHGVCFDNVRAYCLTGRYATFASLAGVDPNDPAQGNVPASDSLDMWPVIGGLSTTSPRTAAALTPSTMLISDTGGNLWK